MNRLPALDPVPTDGVIVLRSWRWSDVEAMTVACRDRAIQRWTTVPVDYSEQDAEWFIAHTEGTRREGTSLELAVVDASNVSEVLGAVGLVAIEWENERAEVGYWTAPHARRRGVATRAVRLLSAWAFATLPVTRLQLTPYADNVASQAVAQGAGYVREGLLRSYYKSRTGLVDVEMFALLRSDFDSRSPPPVQKPSK